MKSKRTYSVYLLPLCVGLGYLFLYLPIIVLIIFSFNKDVFGYHWAGFTLQWYTLLFNSVEIWEALRNSLLVALSSVFFSLVIGILLVFYGMYGAIHRFIPFFYTSLAVPEIVLAVGLLSFFYFFSIPLGLTTLVACHTLIGLGYLVPIIYARFSQLDESLVEASLDLGATHALTFFQVVLPLLSPALISGAMLVFIISFDDFLLSFFCSGASIQTLPVYIFSMIRTGASPVVSALSTLLLVVSSLLVLLFSSIQVKRMDELL